MVTLLLVGAALLLGGGFTLFVGIDQLDTTLQIVGIVATVSGVLAIGRGMRNR